MEKKQILIYAGIGAASLGLVVGTVLFLRSRSAPQAESETLVTQPAGKPAVQTGKTGVQPAKIPGVRPYTPIESLPVKESWKPGDPPIKIPDQPAAAGSYPGSPTNQ